MSQSSGRVVFNSPDPPLLMVMPQHNEPRETAYLSTSFQKFANVSKEPLATRAAPNRAATVTERWSKEYKTAFTKRCA